VSETTCISIGNVSSLNKIYADHLAFVSIFIFLPLFTRRICIPYFSLP